MIQIAVYLDDGRVYSYDVAAPDKAREHAAAIAKTGYRHCANAGELEHYPPWRILKIKCTGDGIGTCYPDRARGT